MDISMNLHLFLCYLSPSSLSLSPPLPLFIYTNDFKYLRLLVAIVEEASIVVGPRQTAKLHPFKLIIKVFPCKHILYLHEL